MAKLVSKVYGDALYAAAGETGRLDEFFEDVKGLKDILRDNHDWDLLMDSPKIVREEKVRLIEETFSGKVAGEIIGLMCLLVEKGHYKDTVDVFNYFINLVKEEKRIGVAYVESALELSDEQKAKVEEKLLATTHYQTFEMHYTCDESLIGGLIIRIGDRVVDSSVRTKLNDLSKNLKNIQLTL